MILRCTTKARALVGVQDDWYLNLLWFDGRKCLLLAHVGTLFPVLVAIVNKANSLRSNCGWRTWSAGS